MSVRSFLIIYSGQEGLLRSESLPSKSAYLTHVSRVLKNDYVMGVKT